MCAIVVTLDTSHLEMSPINLFASGRGLFFVSRNNRLISVTPETSQDPIGFDRPLAPSIGDISSVSAMAFLSPALDFRTNTAVVCHLRSQMDGMVLRVRSNVRA